MAQEVIQPQVPRLPCYDFIPITSPTLGHCLLALTHVLQANGFHDVTGGVYKAGSVFTASLLIRHY